MAFTPNSMESMTTDGRFGMQWEPKLLTAFCYSQLELVTSYLSKLKERFGNGIFGKDVSANDVSDVATCRRTLERLKPLIEGHEILKSLYSSLSAQVTDFTYKHMMYLDGKIKVKILNETSAEIDAIEISLKKSIWGQVEEKYAFSEWGSLWYNYHDSKFFNGYDSHAESHLRPFFLREKFDYTSMQKIRESLETFDDDFNSMYLELKIRPEHTDGGGVSSVQTKSRVEGELDGDQAGAGKAKTTSKRMAMPKISFLDHKESAEERELERLFTSKGPA